VQVSHIIINQVNLYFVILLNSNLLTVFRCCYCVAVIGKGGEQIASIQSESECKIQFAPGTFS